MHVLATYPRAMHQQQGARHVLQLVRQARADHSVERVANSLAADPHTPQKNHLLTRPSTLQRLDLHSTLEARVGRRTRMENSFENLPLHPRHHHALDKESLGEEEDDEERCHRDECGGHH